MSPRRRSGHPPPKLEKSGPSTTPQRLGRYKFKIWRHWVNKVIILPVAFLLSAFAAGLIEPILVLGGVYLSYEGVEKLVHYVVPHRESAQYPRKEEVNEKARIRSAVMVDFILSVEIIILALSASSDAGLTVTIRRPTAARYSADILARTCVLEEVLGRDARAHDIISDEQP